MRPGPLAAAQASEDTTEALPPSSWTTPSHSRWEWNDEAWQEGEWGEDGWTGNAGEEWSGDPDWSGEGATDGWLTDAQVRQFYTADVEQTTALVNGRWSGSYDRHYEGAGGHWRDDRGWEEREPEGHHRGKASEKLVVPTFDGESTSEQDFGKSARSYLRKIQVWLRCTRMPADQRALAL